MFGQTKMAMQLMSAMAEYEGWEPPMAKNGYKGSRAYRNNNPGNLTASPFAIDEEDGFSIFRTEEVGWCAFEWDLMQKSMGMTSTDLNGSSSVEALISIWAPKKDGNNPEAYVDFVVEHSGIAPETTLQEIFAK